MGLLLRTGLARDTAAFLTRFSENEQGSTAIEYGLIASAIAVSISAVFASISDLVTGMFEGVLAAFGG